MTGSNVEIANKNPFRYRGYYYDTETGLYYLHSRYYDPEVGRFINCDDVNYIGVTESEASYNPFAYCENEPVNSFDMFGYWGADIHYGRKKYPNKKYVNSKGKYVEYDGTFEWAISLGFKDKYADKLADACRLVDKSPIYGPVIATRAGFGHHFNYNSYKNKDSRIEYSEKWFDKAVEMFKSAKKISDREKALKILGRGLHALQDYSAHGDFFPIVQGSQVNVKADVVILVHSKEHDNPFFDWKNDKKRSSFGPVLAKTGRRYQETKNATILYLGLFLVAIGKTNQKYICNI